MKKVELVALFVVAFAWSAAADESPLVIEAEASIKQVRYDVAVDLLTRAIANNANDSRAYCDRAYAYFGERDITRALADCHTAIQIDGNNAQAYCVLGNINWITGHREDAASDFDEALHLAPADPVMWYSRGLFYLRNDDAKAVEDFTQALRLSPRYWDAYYNRGNAWFDEQNYAEAIQDYTAAIVLKPEDGNIYHQRAFSLDKAGKLQDAIADYTKAIALKPQSDVELYCRGYAYAEAHDYARAVQDFTGAIQFNPQSSGYYYQRSLAYAALGDKAHADADLKESVLLKSQAPPAQ